MRVFVAGNKVNFIDRNDVYVGCSGSQCCKCLSLSCFSWAVVGVGVDANDYTLMESKSVVDSAKIDGFIFDTSFFEAWSTGREYFVSFRLRYGAEVVFLTLSNLHKDDLHCNPLMCYEFRCGDRSQSGGL